MDLTNQQFGLLKVLRFDHDNPKAGKFWLCECSCQKDKRTPLLCSVRQDKLLAGETTSCGCAKLQQETRGHKNTNCFDILSKSYGIGIMYDGRKFYFDLEDYDLITSVSESWHVNDGGYVAAIDIRENGEKYPNGRKKIVYLKDIVMNKQKNEKVKFVDCKNKLDCRKANLRKETTLN